MNEHVIVAISCLRIHTITPLTFVALLSALFTNNLYVLFDELVLSQKEH